MISGWAPHSFELSNLIGALSDWLAIALETAEGDGQEGCAAQQKSASRDTSPKLKFKRSTVRFQTVSIEPRFEQWKGKGSLVALVWSLNGVRRHLNAGQKAAIAVEMLPLLEKEARDRQKASRAKPGEKVGAKVGQKIAPPSEGGGTKSATQAAAITGTNKQYVKDCKKLKAKDPKLFDDVKAGKSTLVAATRKLKEAKREARRQDNREKVKLAPAPDVLTSGAKFATITIDPPWDWGDVEFWNRAA